MVSKSYCVFCKKMTDNKDVRIVMTKNNKPMMKSICTVCNHKKTRFLSMKEIKADGLLTNLFHKLKSLPILNKLI